MARRHAVVGVASAAPESARADSGITDIHSDRKILQMM
jgi:hypothetical protein